MKKNGFSLKILSLLAAFVFISGCGKTDGNAPSSTTSPLVITPNAITLAATNNHTFTATGGSGSYSYSIFSGSGSILSTTGNYTAPAAAGTDVIRVVDGQGQYADSVVTVVSSMQISPSSQSVLLNGTISFSVTGGVTPIVYTVFSGIGSVNSSTGLYTAPNASGVAVVRATDAVGNTSDANVTISNALTINPSSYTLAVNNTKTFTVTGGTSPYTFSVLTGGGSVNSASGLYTAPGTSGTATVRVTDNIGATSDSSVTINAALQISPSSYTLAVNNTTTFTTTGGVGAVTYAMLSGSGTVNSNSGLYTAPGSSGSATVRATDSLGNTSDATITINPALAISPATLTLAVNNTDTFSASGGAGTYTYSVVSGGGNVNSSSGFFTAPSSAGSVTVRVTDSLGNTSNATVTVNAALVISPATKTLAVTNPFTFSASGGVSPYTYSITSGGGSINGSSGLYTAPGTAGSATVTVTDNLGNTSDAIVTINAALQISPASITITTSSTTTFSQNGGVSPFTYSKVSGVGSIDSSSGLYTAPGSSGSATVRVTDSLSNTSDAVVTISNVLAINPGSPVYVVTDGSVVFSATGGTGPYTFSCATCGANIDSVTGDYVAASVSGTDTVTVTDNLSATASATVTVYDTLTLSPNSVTLAVNATQAFTATGGYGGRTFSLVSGVGSIDSSSGVYTAPANSGSAIIQVADTIGNVLQASITVVSSLTITPRDIYLPVSSTVNTYSATLGTGPYTFSVDSGGGVINSASGLYSGSATSGTGVVRVTDSLATTDTTNVYHIIPVDIKSNWGYHVCALYAGPTYSNYKLKCWGYNNSGQLGYGDTNSRGDATSELGYGSKFVDVGTNKFVKKVAVGWYHTCAILNDDTVKCWGMNTYGQLGYGNTTNKGNASGQMGDNLANVNLGTGRTAKEIYAFGYRTCAILDNNDTKCWGRNITGQLGQGNVTNYGSGAGQMGDSLPAISLGTSRYATKLAGTENTTCALLDNGSLKCFGLGASGTYSGTTYTYYGELGLETNNKTWGDGAGEMGDSLPTVDVGLGGGESIIDIAGGRLNYCVVISTGVVKCWGRNSRGQLGIDNTTNKGDVASTMGASLISAISVTSGTTLAMMRESSCVVTSAGAGKCWGRGSNGQLLKGNVNNLGDNAGEMAALGTMNVGTGRTIKKLSGGYYFTCAILDNDKIKCWGANSCGTGTNNGCMLTGTTAAGNMGDVAGEIGDSLPYVNH